jgi:hypothetical protein
MKRVLIIGSSGVGEVSNLTIQRLKELHGNDVQIYTSEQAFKEGLKESDFINIPTYKIELPPKIEPLAYFTGGSVGKGGRARNRSKNYKNDKFHK